MIEPSVAYSLGDEEAGGYTYEELSALTKTELLEIAENEGITGVSINNLKEDIIQAILGAA